MEDEATVDWDPVFHIRLTEWEVDDEDEPTQVWIEVDRISAAAEGTFQKIRFRIGPWGELPEFVSREDYPDLVAATKAAMERVIRVQQFFDVPETADAELDDRP